VIYLDNAATTPLDPEVLDTMIEFMKNEYGNPSSKYYPQAISAQNYLVNSRKQVAELINCEPEYILFTSGATESNNFVIKGVAEKHATKGKHIITSKIEHKSVLETCKHLERLGYNVTYLEVDQLGHINIKQLEESITNETILVSIMWGNNEIGTLNDIKGIGEICIKKDVLFHTDATQVMGKIHVDMKNIHVDFLSMSAHKIYGPKGIGAIYVGPDMLGLRRKIPSLLDGGSQEYKLRAGTHAMHNIVGFGKACEVARLTLDEYIPKLIANEQLLKDSLLKIRPDITFNGDQKNKIPGLLSINIPGINNELLCKEYANEFAISTGSACSVSEKSYVIDALLPNSSINYSSVIRICLSKFNIDLESQINKFIKLVK